MNTVKYFLLARFIRLFLQFGFLFALLAIVFNILVNVFNIKPYIKVDNWTFGNTREGHLLGAGLSMQFADTVIYYKNGMEYIDKNSLFKRKNRLLDKDQVTEKIVNKFEVTNTKGIEISNEIDASRGVGIYVKSKNWKYNLFWIVCSQIGYLTSALFFLVLIKLVNRYMDNEIFEQRTFKLVALLGWLMIGYQVFLFITNLINGSILEHPGLSSTSSVNEKIYNHLIINLDFYSTISFATIGMGILIILLAEVLRIAIFAKQENQLTI